MPEYCLSKSADIMRMVTDCYANLDIFVNDFIVQSFNMPKIIEEAFGLPLVEVMVSYELAFNGLVYNDTGAQTDPLSLSGLPHDSLYPAACEASIRIRTGEMLEGPSKRCAASLLADFDTGTWNEYFEYLGINRKLLRAYAGDRPGYDIFPPYRFTTKDRNLI